MPRRFPATALLACAALGLFGCGTGQPAGSADAGGVLTLVDASAPVPIDASWVDAIADTGVDAPPSRFITQIIDFKQGTCAGYGANDALGMVAGPPQGLGDDQGGVNVLSLGGGGSLTVGFGQNAIVDRPGIDFVVFENPFNISGGGRYVEPGRVSVSEDGVHWTAFPCNDTTQEEPDGGWGATHCGGMNLVFANSEINDISPFDLDAAGGDQFDLADIGVSMARYVRIDNMIDIEPCPDSGVKPDKNGFDLDAIAIINAALP
jgi:hypothetical protein